MVLHCIKVWFVIYCIFDRPFTNYWITAGGIQFWTQRTPSNCVYAWIRWFYTHLHFSLPPFAPSNLPARCPDSSASRIWNEICVLPTGRSRPRVISPSKKNTIIYRRTCKNKQKRNFEVFRTVFIIRKLTNSKVLTFLVLGDLSGTSDETSSSGCNKTDLLTRRCVTSDSWWITLNTFL